MSKILTFFIIGIAIVAAYALFFRADEPQNQPVRNPALVGDRQATQTKSETQENNKLANSNSMKDSRIQWSSKKVVGSNNHIGTVDLKSGKFEMEGNDVTGGNFVIDMASIKNEDISNQAANEKLVGHLKSDDFFSVEKFPEATFTGTKVEKLDEENYQITGDLTIKGITKSITFPATITKQDDSVVADAEFSIDRTDWDIRFGSNTFFDNLGDQAIDDMINFNIHLES